MTASFYNLDIEILRRTNTGTNFKPVYTWEVLEPVRGVCNLLTERRTVFSEGGVVLADHIMVFDYTDVTTEDILQIDDEQYTIYSIHNPNRMNIHLEIKVLKKKAGENVLVN